MIEPIHRPQDEPPPRRALELEIDLQAVLAEIGVDLEDVLEYGVGSVIDLGSSDEIRVRVRVGDGDLAEGEVVASESPPPDGDQTETHQKTPARPRLGVRLNDVSWERLGDVLRS